MTGTAQATRRTAAAGLAVAALAALAACSSIIPGSEREAPKLYDLSPKSTFDPNLPKIDWQLIVEEPVAAAGLNSARIALRRNPLTLEYYARVAWTDTAPKMVQTRMIESFENTHKVISVGRESVGLRSDFLLKTELRHFEVDYFTAGEGKPRVVVRIVAKLVRMPERTIVADLTREVAMPAEANTIASIVDAFDESLGKMMKAVIEWTIRAGEEARVKGTGLRRELH